MTKRKDWFILLFLMSIAYIFSISLRFIYIDKVSGIEQFYWQTKLMINNVDGYYYAEGARDILAGFHQANDLSPVNNPLSILTAWIVKIFHIPLDTLIFYMPGIFGSLIVVPLILIGRLLGNIWVGFLAALLSGIAWSYYHRTMFGYYDTDMLTVVLPTFAVWAVMWSLKNKDKRFFFLAPLFVLLMEYWHGGLHNIAIGIVAMSGLYLLYLKFWKKEDIAKELLLIVFLLIPIVPIGTLWLKIVLLALLQVIVFKKEFVYFQTHQTKILLILAGVFLLFIAFPWIYNVISNRYFTREVAVDVGGVKYYDVVNTVREASKISYDVFVHRISGSWFGFIAGVIGYLWMLSRFPLMWISLPMVVLGFFALQGGLRFTIFAVPFIALGGAYLFWRVGEVVSQFILNETVQKIVPYIVSTAFMIGIIYPNHQHIYKYIMPTTFNKYEVEVLDKLKHIAKRTDYVLTWWDYGYPIRYYADVKTLVDGGKHSGKVNYPVSFALTRPQLPSYNMAILDVYFTETHYKDKKPFDIVKDIMRYYKLSSIDEVEPFLYKKIDLPKVKEDIYYFLPLRMLDIYPTVALFSYIDLHTGKLKKRPFFIQTSIRGKSKQGVVLSNGIVLGLNGLLYLGKQRATIHSFVNVFYKNKNRLTKQEQLIDPNSNLYVIFMRSYNKVLIMDKDLYNSTFIQLFVLENIDKNLFEPVIKTPYVKVFRVKK